MMDQYDLQEFLESKFGIAKSHDKGSYATRMVRFLVALSELPSTTAQQANLYRQYASKLSEFIEEKSDKIYSRRELYSNLTHEPFFCTLLLIDDDKKAPVYYCLLAHLYHARSFREYRPYLRFYQALLAKPSKPPFTLTPLRSLTLDEVRLELMSLSELSDCKYLHELARFMQRPNQLPNDTRESLMAASNCSVRNVLERYDGAIEYIEMTDELGRSICELLQWTPRMQQTDRQLRSRFSRAKTGLKHALYYAESVAPWSGLSATPSEIGRLLAYVDTAFIDQTIHSFSEQTAGVMVLFFLKLLGIKDPGELELINAGSPNFKGNTVAKTLIYHMDKYTGRVDTHVRLSAELLNVAKPKVKDNRVLYAARKYLDISLPHPIPILLKSSFRKVPAARRNRRTLFEALGLTNAGYRSNIKTYIKQTRLNEIGLSVAGMERAFYHYAKERLPEVTFNFLHGKSSVQHHYISLQRATIEAELKDVWLQFLDAAGIARASSDLDNTAFGFNKSHHDEVGSALTLRDEVLSTMLQHYHTFVIGRGYSPWTRLNASALYIYLRVASSVALRPVREPFPVQIDFDSNRGAFTVADKRAHHSEERRLIIVPTSLTSLLVDWTKTARCMSLSHSSLPPTALLMHYDVTSLTWEHLSPRFVNAIFQRDFKESISNRSFRHVAASNFMKAQLDSKRFSQSALNLLLNHQRAGVSLMNQRSLINLDTLLHHQRKLIETKDRHDPKDTDVLKVLRELRDDI